MYEFISKAIIALQSKETGLPLSGYKAIKIAPNSYQIEEVGKMAAPPALKSPRIKAFPREESRAFEFHLIDTGSKVEGALVSCCFKGRLRNWPWGFLVPYTLQEIQSLLNLTCSSIIH